MDILLISWGVILLMWSIVALYDRKVKSFWTLSLICFALAKLITIGTAIHEDINSNTYKCTESINQELDGEPLLGYGIQ